MNVSAAVNACLVKHDAPRATVRGTIDAPDGRIIAASWAALSALLPPGQSWLTVNERGF